jgi:hypothetical protein
MTMMVKLEILQTYFADLLFCYQMAVNNVGFNKYQLVITVGNVGKWKKKKKRIGQQSWSVKSVQLENLLPLITLKNSK